MCNTRASCTSGALLAVHSFCLTAAAFAEFEAAMALTALCKSVQVQGSGEQDIVRAASPSTQTPSRPPLKKRCVSPDALQTADAPPPSKKARRAPAAAAPDAKLTKHRKYAKICSVGGCEKYVQSRGLCWAHGARAARKLCSREGCTNYSIKGSVCVRHGARTGKSCSQGGCTNRSVKAGVCWRHGANKGKVHTTSRGNQDETASA